MLTIGFIQPSSEYLFDPFRGDPFTHFYILTIIEENLGSAVECKLIDLRGIKKEFATYHVPECDVYLYSVYTLDYDEQVAIVQKLKEEYPKSIHIAGGPHIATFVDESSKIFDVLIIGEGEKTIIEALKDLGASKLKKIYQHLRPIDINDYPHSLRKYLPKSVTARENMMTLRSKSGFDKLTGTTVIFSRGCPYSCNFCALTQDRINFPGIRYRNSSNITNEIEYLKKEYGIQGLVLQDEICIPQRTDLALQHLETIGNTNIVWRGQCRVDGLTPELVKLARQSGCIAMGMGVESANQLSLEIINKRISVEESKKAIALFKENEIEARIYLIIGLPGETPNIVEKTWSFIEETNPDMVVLSLFTVRPGTEMYNNPERFGLKLLPVDHSKTMHMFGRYENEEPTLTFEYFKQAPWGDTLSNTTIIQNYLELQTRLRERGVGNAYYKK